MKVEFDTNRSFLPSEVENKVTGIIQNCLNEITTSNGEFVVNDTLCFRKQRSGKITTCVMNSAPFLSKRFQKNLSEVKGCDGEINLLGQNIDGLITTSISSVGYKIKNKDRLLEVIHKYIQKKELSASAVYTLFPMFYGMFGEREIYAVDQLPKETKDLFEEVEGEKKFRIGVEFETGNVASSFRAINKLFVLFQRGVIDAGILVTSMDKANCATRIWPVSNRNGSLQELRQRQYMDQISLPLISAGFAPDRFDSNAKFLGRDGGLYDLQDTGRKDASGAYNIYYGEGGEEVLKPLGM